MISPSHGTNSMRRTKATLICKRTKNLRAVQLLLGHTKLESTVRYFGIEVDDALGFRSRPRSDVVVAARRRHDASSASCGRLGKSVRAVVDVLVVPDCSNCAIRRSVADTQNCAL